MPQVSDISDDFYDPIRYHFIDRSKQDPNVDVPLIRTFRCYRNADDYLHPRVSYGKSVDAEETNGRKIAFEECIDVQHFKPEEISVKVEKNSILVHAKHAEKQDEQGYISRQFKRRYELPTGCRGEDVVSAVSRLMVYYQSNAQRHQSSNGQKNAKFPLHRLINQLNRAIKARPTRRMQKKHQWHNK